MTQQTQDRAAAQDTDGAKDNARRTSRDSDSGEDMGGGVVFDFDADIDALLRQDDIDAMGSQDDLKHVLRVQPTDKGKTDWEASNVGKYRNDGGRPEADWAQSSAGWTRADVEYARQVEKDWAVQNKRPKAGGKSVNLGGASASASVEVHDGVTKKQTERTQVQDGVTHKQQDTVTEVKKKGAQGPESSRTHEQKRSRDDGNHVVTVDGQGSSSVEESEHADKLKVNKQADIATFGEKASAAAVYYDREFVVSGGFKFKVSYHLAAASAEYGGGAGLNESGATADAGAGAKANLGDFKLEGMWSPGYLTFMGEQAKPTFYLNIEGRCGVEAAASAEASAGKVPAQATGPNPDMTEVYSLGAGGGGSAFAGAQLGVAAGFKLDWKKGAEASYHDKLRDTGELLVSLATRLGGVPGSVAGYLLNVMGTGELVGEILEHVVSWGPPGDTTLLMVEGNATGSAGAGISGEAKAEFKAGKINFKASGGITVGVGGAAGVTIGLDAIQGPLFLMIAAGQMSAELKAWAMDKLREAWADGIELGAEFWEWLDGDDKAVEAVEAGYHKSATATDRARLVDQMLDWVVVGDSERALIEVLNYSDNKGDLTAVSSAMNSSWVDVIEAIDGGNYRNLCNWLVDQVYWCVTVANLRYPRGGTVFHDGSEPPFVYFDCEYNVDNSDADSDFDREESYSSNPAYNYYLQMNDLTTDVVHRFWDLKCQADFDLKAEFYRLDDAYEYRYGGHGIFPKAKH